MESSWKLLDSQGYTSTVYRLPGNPPRVCKVFGGEHAETHFPVERAAYERFAAHNHPSSILQYYGVHDSISSGIILELAEKQDLHRYVWDQKRRGALWPDNETLYRWATQAAEALEFAHSLGVYNSDIHCVNFFLDGNLDLKVGDWAGASIDGSVSVSSYRLRHRMFAADGTDVPRSTGITVSTEIFAFGTALYHMVAGHEPWPELREPEDREEIKRRIIDKAFPPVTELPVLSGVVRKCWSVEFDSMTEVRLAIETERMLHATNESIKRRPS